MKDAKLVHAARTLRTDRIHGAMELAARAIDLATELVSGDPAADIHHVALALATARPSMAAIANAVALHLVPVAAEVASRAALREQAVVTKERWAADAMRLAEAVKRHIPEVILTYSNSSSTRNTLLTLKDRLRSVIVPEGRPINDGRLLATTLAAAGIPVTVVTEGQMGWWVRQVEAIVVGADTVAPDGAVYNHMGTATLALVAREHAIPVYSLTHTLKVAPYDRPDDMREENDPAEVWADPPSGITVRNPTFDRTPASQITVLTERGILDDALRAVVVAEHRVAWETLGLDTQYRGMTEGERR